MIRPTSLAGGRDHQGGHARYQFGKSRIEAQPNEPVRPLGSVLRNMGATNCPPRIPKNSFGSTKAVSGGRRLYGIPIRTDARSCARPTRKSRISNPSRNI